MKRRPPRSPLFPYTTLFRSTASSSSLVRASSRSASSVTSSVACPLRRSEEHTSALQSQFHLLFLLFFFNETATTEISPLSLHDALPIYRFLELIGARIEQIGFERHKLGRLPAEEVGRAHVCTPVPVPSPIPSFFF